MSQFVNGRAGLEFICFSQAEFLSAARKTGAASSSAASA